MPRHPKTHVTEPKEWFPCLVAYCPTKFRSIHGRTRHINTKHTRDELQQDDIQLDFPIVSELPRIPQHETLDELDGEASNDFELLGDSSYGFDTINSPDSHNTVTHIQPQLEEHSCPGSEFFSSSPSKSPPPSGHLDSPTPFQASTESVPVTEEHPFINGKYSILILIL